MNYFLIQPLRFNSQDGKFIFLNKFGNPLVVNNTGKEILCLLQSEHSEKEIYIKLHDMYPDIPLAFSEGDLQDFLGKLVSAKVIVCDG